MTRRDVKEIARFLGIWLCVIPGAWVITHFTAGKPELAKKTNPPSIQWPKDEGPLVNGVPLIKPYTTRLIHENAECMKLPILSAQSDACFKAAENRCLVAMMADKDGDIDDCKGE